jgi:hypothetical protein
MNTVTNVGEEALANTAFERVQADLAAWKPEELLTVNLDISAAVATVLGVLPEARALREQIAKELPSFDVARFDKLEDYALALSYAQAKYLSATQPPDDLDALSEEAASLRERLLAEARSLTHHGLVSSAQLAQLKGANGYKNVATDLMVLTSVMQAGWTQIQGKTPTTAQDLEHASRVATRLLRIVGLREQGPAQVAQATDTRLRAYTTFFRTYEDARRAVTYLRARQGDADSIMPALHPGRPRRRTVEEDATEIPAGSVAPPAPGSAPGAETGNTASGSSIAVNGPFVPTA